MWMVWGCQWSGDVGSRGMWMPGGVGGRGMWVSGSVGDWGMWVVRAVSGDMGVRKCRQWGQLAVRG